MRGDEIGFFKSYLKKLHIKNILDLASKRKEFDQFVDRVGHYFEGTGLKEDELPQETLAFKNLRTKLDFGHTFTEIKITSTRTLPINHGLTVIFNDVETKEFMTFQSNVIENNEFFLGIRPPNFDFGEEIYKTPPELEVSFLKGKHLEYSFESRFVRITPNPKRMWYIQHTQDLNKQNNLKPLKIDASVMLSDQEDLSQVLERRILITFLTNKAAAFRLKKEADLPSLSKAIQKDNSCLINFKIDDAFLTCRGTLIDVQDNGTEYFCKLTFNSLEQEDEQVLIRYMFSQRKGSKKKKKKNAGSTR
jgi:hypothetical protein